MQTKRQEKKIATLFKKYHGSRASYEGKISISCIFYRKDRRRFDIDNALKLALDSLNGIAWKDDCQVVHLGDIWKDYDKENPRTEITVRYLDEIE